MTDTYLDLDEDLERPVVTRWPQGPPRPTYQPLSATVRYPPGPVPDVEDDVPRPVARTSGWIQTARRVRSLLAAGPGPRRSVLSAQPLPRRSLRPAQPWPRRRVLAGLLGIFLGALGLHAVYLGHRRRGLTMLAVTVVAGPLTFGLAAVLMGAWGFAEGLVVLCARRGRFAHDAWGRPLRG